MTEFASIPVLSIFASLDSETLVPLIVIPASLTVLAIVAVWQLVRTTRPHAVVPARRRATDVRPPGSPRTEELAMERLERGEITRDDYERILAVLRS